MDSPKKNVKTELQLRLDYRVLCVVMLLVIVGMLAFWQPWKDARADQRTIEVTGQAIVTAAPDEFVFYPTYEFKNSDKQTALNALSQKSDEVVAKIKALGVPDNKIKTNSSGYEQPVYKEGSGEASYTLTLTVSVDSKDMAQKVQDYLVTTGPSGAVSPQAQFSQTKRNELEGKARDEATKDARAKAEQSAKNLGFGLGAVKTVTDGAGFGVYPYMGRGDVAVDSASPQLEVQPGENELSYSVTVTYFLR